MSREVESVRGLVSAAAKGAPDSPAIEAPGRRPLSFSRLLETVDAIGWRLRQSGVTKSDVVGLVMPNGPEAAASFLGVASHACAAPMNPSYREAELEFAAEDLNMRAVVVPGGSGGPIRTVAAERGIELIELEPGLDAGSFDLDSKGDADPGADDDIALILHTSGTTSRPKAVPLRHRNLVASARHVADTLELSTEDRVLNIMPLFHIHGLVAALLASMRAGGSVICTPGFSAPDFFRWMDEMMPTWYSAVPTMHQAILERAPGAGEVIARTPLRLVRSSSASLPASVMTDLESALGVPVIEAYGMTEAAHQMTSNLLPPGRRMPGTVGVAAGPDVAIMDDEGTLLGPNSPGEIVIRGPNVTTGYLNSPAADAAAFTNGWFRTGDLGVLDSDGYLTITGRRKEIINRGGETIAPREIDEVLLSHPDVKQALAFAVPDTRLGEQVAAAVVLDEDSGTGELELRRFAGLHLSPAKVPRRILMMDDIPKGPTGKLQRIGLATRLGLEELDRHEEGSVPTHAPSTAVERLLAELWGGVLDKEVTSVGSAFLDLGGDSILAIRLLALVRDAIAVDVDMIEFFDSPTLYQQAALIENRLLEDEAASDRR